MSRFRTYLPYLIIWTVANLLQAAFTGLLHDEAYYWVYANNLAWGYFDHPPAVAACIRAGISIIGGELGVRLLPVLCSTVTMAILYHWVRPANNQLFFLFLCSIAVIHMGFLAVPDVPLITLACAFMVGFEQYLNRDTWKNALILAVITVLLMYAKYHGAVLLIIAFLSQIRLLKRGSFWVMIAVALLLYLPHFIWLAEHDLVTLRYHLFERAGTGFDWRYPTEYLLAQLVVYGPLLGIVILASSKRWAKVGIAHTARWIVISVFGLFFLSSFRGRVEANWTTIALPALVFVTYRAIEGLPAYVRYVRIVALITIPLIIVLRVLCVIDITRVAKLEEVHGWERWTEQITEAAGDRIPVFRNSYQYASKYMYYAGRQSFSCNDAANKGNQYDLLYGYERAIQGMPVLYLSGQDVDSIWDVTLPPIHTVIEPFHQRRFEAFESYNQLNVRIVDPPAESPSGVVVILGLEIENPTAHRISIDTAHARMSGWFQRPGEKAFTWITIDCLLPASIEPEQRIFLEGRASVDLDPGTYDYRMGIRWKETGGKNSFQYRLHVTPGR